MIVYNWFLLVLYTEPRVASINKAKAKTLMSLRINFQTSKLLIASKALLYICYYLVVPEMIMTIAGNKCSFVIMTAVNCVSQNVRVLADLCFMHLL